MSDEPAGRARGRARGRASGVEDPTQGSPPQGSPPGSSTGARGRGGMVMPRTTIPKDVKETVGTTGVNVPLMANYIKFEAPQGATVYDYRVDFEPEVEATFIRRAMIYDKKDLFGGAYIFDGMNNIKSITKVGDEEDPSTEVIAQRKSDQEAITIKIKLTGTVGWGSQEMMRLYNTQIKRNLTHLKYIMLGRHMFDPTQKIDIPEFRISIWPGLETAVNVHDGGVLLVVDTIHKVVRNETVHDCLQQLVQRDRSGFKDAARKELCGHIVMTSYSNKTYKIDDIDFEKNPTLEFDKKGVMTTMVEYFQKQYSVTIKDRNQPLIKVLPSARDRRNQQVDQGPIYLVPELCAMTGLSESVRSDLNLKKQMTQSTQAVPNTRIKNLLAFKNKMLNNENIKQEMGVWGLSFGTGIVNFTGRLLPGERILFHEDPDTITAGVPYEQKGGDFSKQMRGKVMRTGFHLQKWSIIVSQRQGGSIDELSQMLNRASKPLGLILQRPEIIVLDNDRTNTYMEACRKVRDNQMVVIIVPNNNKDRYDTIKKIFCVDSPTASQVITGKTLLKKDALMSVCTKVAIQMAAKLGAEPWALHVPPKKLMVVGYDTHHDGTRKGESVGGFVCSINDQLTRYYSRVAYHKDRNEMSDNFRNNFIEGLKFYKQKNGVFPDRIIIYRDGVSEGQIQHVYEVELKQIQEALNLTAGVNVIRLAFIIVTKRVSSRFFLRTGEKNAENPYPGTIIDHTVTREGRYDFYLISQSVKQGTVGPTNYNIIEDTTNWKPQHHQQLTFKLTHLYFNWMGTIRVPAPCQYAHKLAYLTGTALHKEPATSLCDTLFYL